MIQLDIFYNTTSKAGDELTQARQAVKGQNEKILKFFQQHPYTWFTPWEIHFHFGQQMFITSIRRAITTLTDQGYLVKGERKKSGPANETNFTWRLK
jgi:Fe2+ or Zn2+ uptake regulation protein